MLHILLCTVASDQSNAFHIGYLHPVIIHFPIVLFFVALAYDLLASIRKNDSFRTIAHWTVIIAALFTIPTVITGGFAAELRGSPFLETHERLALITLIYSLVHAAFRVYALRTKKRITGAIFIVATLINVGLVSITAEYGGAVVRGKGIFISKPLFSNEVSAAHDPLVRGQLF